MPVDTELLVWDLFLIKGISVLFSVALTLFQLMQDEILKANDYCDIYSIVDKFGQNVDREMLLKNLYVSIKNKEIKELRNLHRQCIFFDLKD